MTFISVLGPWAPARSEELWPDLSKPAASVGGGEQDAGVVVGIDAYSYVPPVTGAEPNAKAWYDYLTHTRGAAPGNITLLLGVDATRDDMLDAAQAAAAKIGPSGTLWFIFVGHGAPSADGKDGLLVGVDAQQKAESLQKRSLRRQDLLAALAKSRAGSISVILDACFSGRGPDGASIAPGLQPLVTIAAPGAADPRIVVLTAARGDQFAGSLPGTSRPAFSYLALGALRGWAGTDGRVTAGAVWRYATSALDATLRGRNQTPDLLGKESAIIGASAGEKGPDLASLAKATAGGGGRDFQVSSLPALPRAQVPKALDAASSGIDLSGVDVDALEKYDAVSEFDKGAGMAEEKAARWRILAKEAPTFALMAEKRAAEWDAYGAIRKAADEVKVKRMEARDADWAKLSRLLALKVVPAKDKKSWAARFAGAYLESPGIGPAVAAELMKYAADGPSKVALAKLAKSTAPVAGLGKGGLQWVSIPGGTFLRGSEDEWYQDERPMRLVTLKPFQLSKSEVTNKQYQVCVEAGACTATAPYSDWLKKLSGDDHPVMYVSWEQARVFSEWAGGRLPTEAEWEYAARNGGKDYFYPWGKEEATCDKAWLDNCQKWGSPVCTKPAGNTVQGLCDMTGNVDEWVQDSEGSYADAPTDGTAWVRPDVNLDRTGLVPYERRIRGGNWGSQARYSRITRRFSRPPEHQGPHTGFRVAR